MSSALCWQAAGCFVTNRAKGAVTLRLTLVLACLALAACGPYPRDVSGTLDAIEHDGRIRVGLTGLAAEDERAALDLIARLEKATGARASLDRASADRQLARLQAGELDLVIGEFAADTPWTKSIAVIEPLATRSVGQREMELAPAARNGENRWIALIEREVRDSTGPGA